MNHLTVRIIDYVSVRRWDGVLQDFWCLRTSRHLLKLLLLHI